MTPKGVYVREIGQEGVPGTGSFMSETVRPKKDKFLERSQWCGGYQGNNPETFRKLKQTSYDKSWGFNFEGRYYAYLVKGDGSHYSSWYA